MLYQITTLLLDIAVGLLASACLLRLLMQHQRLPFANPVGRVVFALTNWIVLPLRRLVPALGRWDMSSLVAALALELMQYALLWLLFGGGGSSGLVAVPLLAIFGLLRLLLSGLVGLVIVFAVLSWVQPQSLVFGLIARLITPLLRPLQRWIPLVGGIDLSPLVLLVLVQIGLIVLNHAQRWMLAELWRWV